MIGISTLLKLGRGDVRVLKAQLDLTAGVIQQTRLHSIVRSLVLALVASDLIGLFGNTALARALYLPMIVTLAIAVCSSMTAVYVTRTAGVVDLPTIQAWFLRFTGMQAAISAAWGIMPWLLWQPGNPVNHLFLAGLSIAITAGLVVSRGGNVGHKRQQRVRSGTPRISKTQSREVEPDRSTTL